MEKTTFKKIYEVAKHIPRGKVATYKQIATLAGNPKASRIVGMAMKYNPDTTIVPCHRVVASDGSMCGYSAGQGIKTKIEKLKSEGVKIKDDKVDLSIYQWKDK
jgi:methylated-DNA-protein-cysteine methyltransferase-like protein